jgi:hypothetical protein
VEGAEEEDEEEEEEGGAGVEECPGGPSSFFAVATMGASWEWTGCAQRNECDQAEREKTANRVHRLNEVRDQPLRREAW